jgi:hypothetical protein
MFYKRSPSIMEEKMIVNIIKLISEAIRLISFIINLLHVFIKNKRK